MNHDNNVIPISHYVIARAYYGMGAPLNHVFILKRHEDVLVHDKQLLYEKEHVINPSLLPNSTNIFWYCIESPNLVLLLYMRI